MGLIDQNLPLRSSSSGDQIDTRPMQVEEWLDSLPYTDFKKTSQLLFEATLATNRQQLKPSTRLELVELYNRPYQYYIDSQIKAGAQHTLQSIDTVQAQIKILKNISANLAFACKISAEDTLNKKTLWGETKPPITNFFLSLNFLSHALIFSYLEYAPTPKNVWKEINFIYDFAESLSLDNSTIKLPVNFVAQNKIATIAQAYKRIILASMSDPHHLPYGAIWEIYEQLANWVDSISLSKFATPAGTSSQFVIKLDSDSQPIPIIKFNTKLAGDRHRIIDVSNLTSDIRNHLGTLEKTGKLDKSIILSPYFSKLILEHLSSVLGSPAKRKSARKEKKGTLEIACGLNPAFYFLNDMQDFVEPVIHQSEDDLTEDSSVQNLAYTAKYKFEQWELVDQSSSGFAIIKNIKPENTVRVSDLIIIKSKSEHNKWIIGLIRWLMIRTGQAYKIGVQILSVNTETAAIRACSGNARDTRFRRALLVNQGTNEKISVITGKGLFKNNREVEIFSNNKTHKTNVLGLLESTIGFDQFEIAARL